MDAIIISGTTIVITVMMQAVVRITRVTPMSIRIVVSTMTAASAMLTMMMILALMLAMVAVVLQYDDGDDDGNDLMPMGMQTALVAPLVFKDSGA
eukprot:632607-Pyramimonas_sp.AAC.1